jgi:hypothetical protein
VKTHRCRLRGRAGRAGTLALLTALPLAAAPASAVAQPSDSASGGSSAEGRSERPTDLSVVHHARRGTSVSLTGRLSGAESGDTAIIQVQAGRSAWRTIARTTTASGGRFSTRWRPPSVGAFRVRVRPLGEARAASAGSTDVESLNVYRPAQASWYGPGFYGRRTACGRTIRAGTLGVAHKRLPCGTQVTFRYGSRTVTVPVIDRGPYVGSREWDLTAATKRRLGFPSTGTVWSTR